MENVILEARDGVAWLTLNRPSRANSINAQTAHELLHAIDKSEASPGIRVLVLKGEGRFFCAGGDLAEMASGERTSSTVSELAAQLSAIAMRLTVSRMIVVAAVHGPAAGAGLGLVLNADLVVASPTASFLTAYEAVGLTPDCGVSHLLPHIIGPRRAAAMSLGGHRIDAQRAHEWGLVTELVAEDEDLMTHTRRLITRLLDHEPDALAATKRLLSKRLLSEYEAALLDETDTITRQATIPATQARISGFAEK